MTDVFETRLAAAASEAVRACMNRDEEFFAKGHPSLVSLGRLNMRVNNQGLVDWAALSLDKWGLGKVLGFTYALEAENLTHFLTGLTKIDARYPGRGEQIVEENWPLLWDHLQKVGHGFGSILRRALEGHAESGQAPLTDRFDFSHGPFSSPCHHRLFTWASRNSRTPGEDRTSLALVSPLQFAWATQNGPLCELLVKRGAGLDIPYPDSSWPEWTLRQALVDPIKIQLSRPDLFGYRDGFEAFKNACAVYQAKPELLDGMGVVARLAQLEVALPAPVSSRGPKPRF